MPGNTTPEDAQKSVEIALRIVERLERLSVDSLWARRASGLKGSFLKCLEDIESNGASDKNLHHLEFLLTHGYDILNRAAREIPDPQTETLRDS